jgi:hypothetical protein
MILEFHLKDFSICRLTKEEFFFVLKLPMPPLFFLSQTEEGISLIAETHLVQDVIQKESGWGVFHIKGELSFELTSILSPILKRLGDAKVSVLAESTFGTDYVFFKLEKLSTVIACLQGAYALTLERAPASIALL